MGKEAKPLAIRDIPLGLARQAKQCLKLGFPRSGNSHPLTPEQEACCVTTAGELLVAAGNIKRQCIIFDTNTAPDSRKFDTLAAKKPERKVKPIIPVEIDPGQSLPFEALLLQRINQELLPPNLEEIPTKDLRALLVGTDNKIHISGGKLTIRKLLSEKPVITRDETIRFMKMILTKNEGENMPLSPDKQSPRFYIMQLQRVKAAELDALGKTVGFDWKENPRLSRKTVSVICGLIILDRILNARKQNAPTNTDNPQNH